MGELTVLGTAAMPLGGLHLEELDAAELEPALDKVTEAGGAET